MTQRREHAAAQPLGGRRTHSQQEARALRSPFAPPAAGMVLVPLDGSLEAEHALPLALAIARRSNSALRLIHVHSPLASVDDPIQLLTMGHKDAELRRQRQAYLDGIVRRIRRLHKIETTATLCESVAIAGALCDAAQGSDLVVMAAPPQGWWKRVVTGSLVHTLSQWLSPPLLLVPGYASPVDLTGQPIPADVIVPLDGSPEAEQILPVASAFATLCLARLTLLHVHVARSPLLPASAMHYLQRVALSVRDVPKIRSLVIESSGRSAAKAILSFANACDGGMLAAAPPRRATLSHQLQPSPVDSLVAKFKIPILLQRQGSRTPASSPQRSSTPSKLGHSLACTSAGRSLRTR